MVIIMPSYFYKTWNLRWRGPFSAIANYTVSFADVFIGLRYEFFFLVWAWRPATPIVAGILEIKVQKFEEWSLIEFQGCIYHCVISTEQTKWSPVAQIFQVQCLILVVISDRNEWLSDFTRCTSSAQEIVNRRVVSTQ